MAALKKAGPPGRRVAARAVWVASAGAAGLYWLSCWLVVPLFQPAPPLSAGTPAQNVVLRTALLLMALGVSTALRVVSALLSGGEALPLYVRRGLRRRLMLMLAGDGAVVVIALAAMMVDIGLLRWGWLNRVRVELIGGRLLDLISFWPILAAVAGMGLLRLAARVMTDQPYCTCGFSLRGNVTGTCPECGRVVAISACAGAVGWPTVDSTEQAAVPRASRHRVGFIVVGSVLRGMAALSLGGLCLAAAGGSSAAATAVSSYLPVGLALWVLGRSWLQLAFVPIGTTRQEWALRRFARVSGVVDGLMTLVAGGLFGGFVSGLLQARGTGVVRVSVLAWCFLGVAFAWAVFRDVVLQLPVCKPGAPEADRR